MKKVVYTSFIFLGAFLIFACAPARQETLQSQKVEVETEMETKPEPVKTQSFTPAESRSFQRGVQSGDISKINFKTLPGYFLKPSAPLSKNVNVITINSEKKLAQVLGKSQFVKENYSHNFAQNFILVLAIGQSQYSYDIDITDVYVNDSQIYILYKITKTDDIGVRFFKTSAAIFEIARPKIATTIHFIDEAGTSFS
ncbi:MAG: hypothetical protein LBC07_06385, partial [Elusimicrobiota bacterium]|nr:hypothetical protein [Elusimicrobiota bacterium]